MNPQLAQLTDYIRQNLARGVDQNTLYQTLLGSGWPVELVNAAFSSLLPPQPAAPQSAAPQPPQQPMQPAQPVVSQPAAQPYNNQGQPFVGTAMPVGQPEPAAPQKYKVFRAIADAVRAFKANVVAVLIAVAIGYGLLIALFLVFGLVVAGSFLAGGAFIGSKGLLVVIIGVLLLVCVLYALIFGLLVALVATGIRDGREHRKSEIGSLLGGSLRRVPHISLAILIIMLIAILPLIVVTFLLTIFAYSSNRLLTLITGFSTILATVWMLLIYFRYALVPYVALFEPELSPWQTLGRAYYLVRRGGQWFLFKGFMIYFVVSLPVLALDKGDGSGPGSAAAAIPLVIIYTLLLIIGNGVLVQLYFNRKAVKG